MLKVIIGLFIFSLVLLSIIVGASWSSKARLVCRITFLNNSRVTFLLEDRLSVLFVRIDQAMYDEYRQHITSLKKENSNDSNALRDYIRSISGTLYYELYEKKRLQYTAISLNNVTIEKPFELRLKKGFYVVYIFQKGITYFQCLNVTNNRVLELGEENLYFW